MSRLWLVVVLFAACSKKHEPQPAPAPPPPPVSEPALDASPQAPVAEAPDAAEAPHETVAYGHRFSLAIPEGFARQSTGAVLAGGDVMLTAPGPKHLYVMRIGFPSSMHGKDATGCQEVADRVTKTGAKLESVAIEKHKRFGKVCRSVHSDDVDHRLISYTISLGEKDMLAVQCGFPGADEPDFCKRALDDVQLEDDPTKKKPK